MKLQSFKTNQQYFGARLFDENNNRITAFDFLDQLKGEDVMKQKGSGMTDIFVKEFISRKNVYGEFENSIKLTIANPLFGEQSFVQDLHHATNTSVENSHILKMDHLDLLTGLKTDNCKCLENRGVRAAIIDHINKRTFGTRNPLEILDCMLEKTSFVHGFDANRIDDFKQTAKDLLDTLVSISIKTIKK